MTNKLYNDDSIKAIADAIREKNGLSVKYKASEMAAAILAIKTAPILQNKTVTPTKQAQDVRADAGSDGLGVVTVNAIPAQYIVPSGSDTKTQNGTYNVTELAEIVVNVEAPAPVYDDPTITVSADGLITASANGKSATQQLTTQSGKTVAPTKATQQAVDAGRYTTGAVNVAPIPDEYIIPSGSQELTENKQYNVSALASVTVAVPIPEPSYDTPTINVSTGGLITASANGKSNTQQLTTKAAQTITPAESEQTITGAGVYTTGAQKVAAIPADYIGSAVQIQYYHVVDSEPTPASIPEGDFVFIRG